MNVHQVNCGLGFPMQEIHYERPVLEASIDVNRTSFDTMSHWALANRYQRISQTIDYADRADLRSKARYEFFNNDHFHGIVQTLALYVVGTGPRLSFSVDHLVADRKNNTLNQQAREISGYVERRFTKWTESFRYFMEQYNGVVSMILDGESFGVFNYSPNNAICPFVYRMIDSSRICNPNNRPDSEYCKGGILFDIWGNPEQYCILDLPSNPNQNYDYGKYQFIPAKQVCHSFVPDHAEQIRGFCMIASALQRVGRLRDFDDNTLEGAKNAASIIGVIKTQQGYGGGTNVREAFSSQAWENYGVLPLSRNHWFRLPPTADATIMEPKPSNVSYDTYVDHQLQAIGHTVQAPKNVSTNSSATYNYSSAKLDEQRFNQYVNFIRKLLDLEQNNRLFGVFYNHELPGLYERFAGISIDMIPELDDVNIKWRYPVPLDIDPKRREEMFALMRDNGSASLKDIVEMRGNDQNWQDVLDQIATEQAYNRDMGNDPNINVDTIDARIGKQVTSAIDDFYRNYSTSS